MDRPRHKWRGYGAEGFGVAPLFMVTDRPHLRSIAIYGDNRGRAINAGSRVGGPRHKWRGYGAEGFGVAPLFMVTDLPQPA